MRHRLLLALMAVAACATARPLTPPAMSAAPLMLRIAEIEVDPRHRDDYLAILRTEAGASVEREPGVVAILPLVEQERPTQVRILEVYADRAAYEAHLASPHFLHYKSATAHMVTSLRLVEMTAVDPAILGRVLRKLP
jgi:quinol monooxygenase YgiN